MRDSPSERSGRNKALDSGTTGWKYQHADDPEAGREIFAAPSAERGGDYSRRRSVNFQAVLSGTIKLRIHVWFAPWSTRRRRDSPSRHG